MTPSARANSKLEDAFGIRALRSLRFVSVSSAMRVHRKRGLTRLLRVAHTTRLTRSLLPPPLPAGSAPVTRSAWAGGRLNAGSAPGRVPSPDAGADPAFFARRFPRASPRLSDRAMHPSQTRPTPNQALQRTAPRVTAPASGLRLAPTAQVPRRAPQSLSFWSLGH